jgi:acetyltransferase-like isoleucine patch superfamily enzyme
VRVFFCEPFFKAYCTRYGRNVHTGVFLHWIKGRGELIIGDNVRIDGKCSFSFAARFSEQPTLIIGDNTGIGHACSFRIGKKVVIGRHCRIAGNVSIFDSPGHPADPIARIAGSPPTDDEVRPVVIEDNVWIGERAIIVPGVTIGQGSVVAAGAVVMMDVPPNTMVAGNPARQFRKLTSSA